MAREEKRPPPNIDRVREALQEHDDRAPDDDDDTDEEPDAEEKE